MSEVAPPLVKQVPHLAKHKFARSFAKGSMGQEKKDCSFWPKLRIAEYRAS